MLNDDFKFISSSICNYQDSNIRLSLTPDNEYFELKGYKNKFKVSIKKADMSKGLSGKYKVNVFIPTFN